MDIDFNTLSDDDLSNAESKQHVVDYLVSLGYTLLNSAPHSLIFNFNNDEWVMKVFDAQDDYIEYLEYIRTHKSNPYVPNIRNKVIQINDNLFVCLIEKLKQFKVTPETKAFINTNFTIEDDLLIPKESITDKNLKDVIDFLKSIEKPLELHLKDLMLRNNQVVFISPIK